MTSYGAGPGKEGNMTTNQSLTLLENGGSFSWGKGVISAQAGGGMSTASWTFPNGKTVSPFHEVPWRGKNLPHDLDIPPLLQFLRAGTWPCVPFGGPREVGGLASIYTDELDAGFEELPHGPCSNADWTMEKSGNAITMNFECPVAHPISGMKQRISFAEDSPTAVFEVEVHPRADCSLPIGLHPTFRLPAELQPGSFEKGITYPGDFEPGAYILKYGAVFSSLKSVPSKAGSREGVGDTVDLSRLPLPFPCENLVQLLNTDGSFVLLYREEGFRITLRWDRNVFPSCILWMSNGGRTYMPWNGENYCLGVEPVRSDFELGVRRSQGSNLTSQAGTPSCYDFKKGQPLFTKYTVSCELV